MSAYYLIMATKRNQCGFHLNHLLYLISANPEFPIPMDFI